MKLSIEFAKALVVGWNLDGHLLGAIASIGERIDDWEATIAKHGLPAGTFLRQRIQPWIAAHFTNANAALWNGNKELAWKWMASGKDRPPQTRKMRERSGAEAKREMRADAKRGLIIKTRDNDKRHDWKVCK